MIYQASPENIQEAGARVRRGEVVAFPTETVYGLGANAFDEAACQKVFRLKGRPRSNPLIVHIPSAALISSVAKLDTLPHLREQFEKLAPFWPGQLSLVLPKTEKVSLAATAGLNSVAIRVPSHPVAQRLLNACGVPLAAPSANRSSYISPTTAQHVESDFRTADLFILDGGASSVGIESTIVSLLNPVPLILRHGTITEEELTKVLGPVNVANHISDAPLLAPGQLPLHYAPRTRLIFIDDANDIPRSIRAGLVTFSKNDALSLSFDCVKTISLSSDGDLHEVALNLYAALRELDSLGLDLIVVESCEDTGIGRAIMDRLKRAAYGEGR